MVNTSLPRWLPWSTQAIVYDLNRHDSMLDILMLHFWCRYVLPSVQLVVAILPKVMSGTTMQ